MSENKEDTVEDEQEEEAVKNTDPNVTKDKEKSVPKPLTKYDLHLLATKPKSVPSLFREVSYNFSLESLTSYISKPFIVVLSSSTNKVSSNYKLTNTAMDYLNMEFHNLNVRSFWKCIFTRSAGDLLA